MPCAFNIARVWYWLAYPSSNSIDTTVLVAAPAAVAPPIGLTAKPCAITVAPTKPMRLSSVPPLRSRVL